MRRRTRPEMFARARRLRTELTDTEWRLWLRLRELNAHGHSFRRQAPFQSYVLDFVTHRERLVIELDGSQHGEADHRARDAVRDALLVAEGYVVLRFWNYEVSEDIDGVVESIQRALHQQATKRRGA